MPDPVLTPAMTSNTAPSGVCSSTTIIGAGYEAHRAFDQLRTTTMWHTTSAAPPWWLQYQFGSDVTVTSYGLYGRFDVAGYGPKDFKLQGSSNGSSWTDLDSQTGKAMVVGTEYIYTVASPGTFSYYRVYITAGESATYCGIAEFSLYGYTQRDPLNYLHGARRSRLNTRSVSDVVQTFTPVYIPWIMTWSYGSMVSGGDNGGYSFRQIIPASASIASGGEVRMTFKAAAGATFKIASASIGVRSGTASDCTTTPVQIFFNNGSASASIFDGELTSDPLSFSFDETKDHVVIIDYGTSPSLSSYASGGEVYYRAAYSSYNLATVTGFTQTAQTRLTKIEVRGNL